MAPKPPFRAFYSDPHLFHENIIEYEKRPFANVDEMHEALIERYNEVIGPEDTVLWLGDAALKGSVGMVSQVIEAMHGVKLLIRGNHDRGNLAMLRRGFSAILQEPLIQMANRAVRCSHYPYADRDRHVRTAAKHPLRVKGEVLIHGHIHSTARRRENMVHVGVDAWDYRPVLWEEVEALVAEV